MFSLCLTPMEWQELVNFFSFRKSINRINKISKEIYKKLVENPIKPKKDFINQVPLIWDYYDTSILLTDEERQELLRYFNFRGKHTLNPFSKAIKSIYNKLIFDI